MHRKYRPWHYADKLLEIRSLVPDAAIGADVMVGFPGEDDAAFEETRSFIAELPFTYLHVFTYSSRPGTPSATMPDQVPVRVARERNRILRELAAEKNRAFRRQFVARNLRAITLGEHNAGLTEALTDNYIKLRIRGVHAANVWRSVAIEKLSDEGLEGQICS
jgi:threonylcarbamoyladenosine tRNA methylthiotransferase MtaB